MFKTFVLFSFLLPVAAQTVIPAGTELYVRLKTPISSNESKADQAVEAVTIIPVLDQGRVVIPSGVAIKGRIAETKPALKADERAALSMLFTDIGSVRTKAVVADVDNARESVDQAGKIIGILASETLAARANQGIDKVGQKAPLLPESFGVAKGAVLTGAPSGEIKYDPGVELKLKLLEPITWKGASSEPALTPIRDEQELNNLVNAQAFQTIAENPPSLPT